jgi:RNA polymerase-binding transcription factor DksA
MPIRVAVMSDTDPGRIESERADLDRIERELRDVETALARLADGTYWSDADAPPDLPDD